MKKMKGTFTYYVCSKVGHKASKCHDHKGKGLSLDQHKSKAKTNVVLASPSFRWGESGGSVLIGNCIAATIRGIRQLLLWMIYKPVRKLSIILLWSIAYYWGIRIGTICLAQTLGRNGTGTSFP